MKKVSGFPYPYIVKALDEHFGIHATLRNKKQSIDERYIQIGGKLAQKKRMSILIATFWDYPHTGGLSSYIKALSEGLKKLGHQVDIISPNQFPKEEVETIRNEVVPRIKKFFHTRYGSYDSKIVKHHRQLYVYERMLLKNIDLKKYDIFHAQDLFTANILGRMNQYYEKPLFFTPHGLFTFNRLKFGTFTKGSLEEVYFKTLERKAIEFADQLIILSDSFREPLMQLGAKDADMTTVLTGIDYPEIDERKNVSAHKEIVITCVARLGPRKGHGILFDALSQMTKRHTNNIKVLIVGDGEMRETLEKQVNDLGLSMVEFLGTRDDVPNILNKTDVFVLPTLNDSLPLAVIEAMHSGVCVITTTSGGIPELVKHSKTGILVEPGDTEQLEHALKFVITNQKAREQLGENARKFAKKHLTRKAMMAQIETIYKKACKWGETS